MPRIPCTCRVPGMRCYAHPDGPVCSCIRTGQDGDLGGTSAILVPDPNCLIHPDTQEPTP